VIEGNESSRCPAARAQAPEYRAAAASNGRKRVTASHFLVIEVTQFWVISRISCSYAGAVHFFHLIQPLYFHRFAFISN